MAAVFAGALAAGIFASATLASCSNLEGGYGGTDQGANSSILIVGDLPAGMGRVCGKIKDKNDKGSASKTVAPDSDSVTSFINHYDICAWGTPDSGSSVPESSPLHGNVNSSTLAFDIALPFGSWTLRADAIDGSGKIILSRQTATPVTLSDDSPVISANFSLDYYKKSGETGKLSLPLNYDATRITAISYSLSAATPTAGFPISDTVAAPSSGSYTLDGTANTAFDSLPPGSYELVVEFCDANGVVVRLDQSVQIYSNVTTGKIDGSAPYVTSTGGVNVSNTVIQKYESSSFYVGGTGASDSNKGTKYDPLLTIKNAMARIDASSLSAGTEFTIYLLGDAALGGDISIGSGKKVAVIGTNPSSKCAVTGGGSYGISMDGSSLTCKNVTFNKIHGFEISAGQADFANCSITNGSAGSSASGNGGGLYISGSSAKATLESCTISGCEASYGGAIYAAGEVELKDCLIGAEASEAAQEAAGKYSNKANGGGGGIYVSGSGKLSFSGTNKISYNCATGYGGGLNYAGTAQMDLAGVKIEYNYAKTGGGGINLGEAKSATIDSCVVKGNVSKQDGGGLLLGKNSTATISGSEISYNTAEYYGFGGGANVKGKATFTNTNISYNKSLCVNNDTYGGTGGAIYIDTTNSTTLTDKTTVIQNCKITNNQASNNATGISGAQGGSGGGVAIISGDCSISGDDTDISSNQAQYNGGGLYARENSVTFNFSGGTISGNTAAKGGAVYNRGSLLMGGSAYIPAGTDKKNDVCLATGRTVSVASSLTATPTPVATITPPSYSPGMTVLSDTGTGASAGTLVQSELSKFAVVPHSGDEWTIGYNSSSKRGVLATANIYVDYGTGTDASGYGTRTAPFKTVAYAVGQVMAPNCNIILLGDTTESDNIEITTAMAGLKIKSADATAKTITGNLTKTINIRCAATFENVNLDTWNGANVSSDVDGVVNLNKVAFANCNSSAGGGLWIADGKEVEGSDVSFVNCVADGSGGAIYVGSGASLSIDGLAAQNCYVAGGTSDGGAIYNEGTVVLNKAQIAGCSAGRNGGGIYCGVDGVLVLGGATNIASDIFLHSDLHPIQVKDDFALANGASAVPVKLEMDTTGVTDHPFAEGDPVVVGYGLHNVTEEQCGMFVLPGSKYSVDCDGTATPPCGKLVDRSIAGGITINVGANITFEVATPTASGEKATFNVIDNSSGTPTYITPASAQIKIMQYGGAIYSANARQVTAAYLAEGEYELYCKAVVGGVVYDTTLPFGAGGKYTPLTLEAAQAGAVVTFTNKAAGPVTYRVNGGTEQTIASGDSAEITIDNIGDKVQFFGDNAKYGAGSSTTSSNISCSEDCYVYGNIMSLVDSDGFASANAVTGYAFANLFFENTKIKNKTGYDLLLPATTLASHCYFSMFNGCSSLENAPELPATTLKLSCYSVMFYGCTKLISAPALSATTLAMYCYDRMFYGCTGLTNAPELPASSLVESCYTRMFEGCTKLTVAPELPATTLATNCYDRMFDGCTSLTTAPALPATTLAASCYQSMFRGCAKLTTAPSLPATTLENSCYYTMFYGCSKLNSVTCLATDISATVCTGGWLEGVAATGTFTKAAGVAWPTGANGIPAGWVVESVGSAIPAGFVKVEGATITGGDKFKVGSNTGVFVADRTVTLSDFYMCDHEVTQAEYQAVMESNPSNFTGSDDLPVEQVSWFDAIYYCNKKSVAESLTPCYSVGGKTDPAQWGYTPHNDASISGAITCNLNANGYRLPTEAEWEYAALGGKAGVALDDPTDYAGTNNSSQLETYAWYSSNSDSKTHAVKTKTKNSLNLFDMSGNVWEWCWDWKNSSVTAGDGGSASVTNPLGASSGSGRVYRGGSWRSDASSCSVAIRNGSGPFDRGNNLGFRVVRTAQ